jgi:hypothetical protein
MNVSAKLAVVAALLTGAAPAAAPVHAAIADRHAGGPGIETVAGIEKKPIPTPMPRPTAPALPKPAPKKP